MLGQKPLLDTRTRSFSRFLWTLVLGLILGGLLTVIAENFLPESAAREFLTTSVVATAGPFYLNLVAVEITVGPLSLILNVLSLVGVTVVAFIARSWI